MTALEARAVHDEVHCRHFLALLQRVPQALLGRIYFVECDCCRQGAPLPSSQQLMVLGCVRTASANANIIAWWSSSGLKQRQAPVWSRGDSCGDVATCNAPGYGVGSAKRCFANCCTAAKRRGTLGVALHRTSTQKRLHPAVHVPDWHSHNGSGHTRSGGQYRWLCLRWGASAPSPYCSTWD